jgi:hypothetical protein
MEKGNGKDKTMIMLYFAIILHDLLFFYLLKKLSMELKFFESVFTIPPNRGFALNIFSNQTYRNMLHKCIYFKYYFPIYTSCAQV